MIKPAQLTWSEGTPISEDFDDVYFSKASGIEETRYVFLKHNQLPERWKTERPSHFTIAETGFGTGLNFLCAWQSWLESSQAGQHLHFISVEKFPLTREDLETALTHWPELSSLAQRLIEQYPPIVSGWHCIQFPGRSNTEGHITLQLYFGDIHDWLPQIHAKVDAWFLDGFAPSKNPEMWNPELFNQMARLSRPNGTLATFTAAGFVKRGLQAAGYEIKKTKGFGRKRDMLQGRFVRSYGPPKPEWMSTIPHTDTRKARNKVQPAKPWLAIPEYDDQNRTATIVGAGIAGSSTAFALAKRGWQVTVIEESEIASGGSGNAQGVLYAKLASDMNLHSQFYLAGYLYSLQMLRQLLPDKQDWDDCGVLQLATNDDEQLRQQSFIAQNPMPSVIECVTAEQASQLAGVELSYGGLYFTKGGWVHPKALCQAMLNHPNIKVMEHTMLTQVERHPSGWNLALTQNSKIHELNAPVVVFCNGHKAQRFWCNDFISTPPVAGQVTQLAQQTVQLNTVLCGDHYVTPTYQGALNFGASYRLKSDNIDVIAKENQDNIDKLGEAFPAVASQINLNAKPLGRASVRCTSPDYTPYVGPIGEAEQNRLTFANLAKNKHWRFSESAAFLPGLYLNIAHGSRGLSSAPLCGEIIACQITGEPIPVTKDVMDLLNPNRALINEIRRKK